MKPTEELKAEHESIKLMLNILDNVSDKLKSAQEVDRDNFTKMLEFLKIFVDKCHHGKEEDLLLPAMEAAGVPKESGAIKYTLAEHQTGRDYIKGMSEAFDKFKSGDRKASFKIAENGKSYIGLLIPHIEKENTILFPIADKVLSKAKQKKLEDAFEKLEVERIGLGKHEEFHALLHHLKEVYLD